MSGFRQTLTAQIFVFQILALTLCLAPFYSVIQAHDYIPGNEQSQPILLRGGDLYTVTQGVLTGTDLLFENGRITRIEQNLQPPVGARVIDVTGKNVYPGLIAATSRIGLTEIGEVRATNDYQEVGARNSEVKAYVAYNPDSEIIPTVRSNGITTANVVPSGNLIMGRSSLFNLDGWTVEDAAEKLIVGLHINWPRARLVRAWWMEESEEEQRRKMKEGRKKLDYIFTRARTYADAKEADQTTEVDLRWEAMLPVFSGELPVFIHADDLRQIQEAVAFARKHNFKMVLVGGLDAWKAPDLLRDNDIPVVIATLHRMPGREDDGYELAFKLPRLLHDAGVDFCISMGFASWGARNLPFQVAQAVAFGLPPEVAVRSVTLSPAEILGVDSVLGSLEVGKKATLVVSDGDLFDHLTHRVQLEFIEGREVDLNNKHRELYEKYRAKGTP